MALAWFPCYVNDLLGSLAWRCMTPAQRGAYWQLICCQMQAETGTLPEDTAMLSRLAELDLGGENGIVLDKFPLHAGGGRANPRAYAEWLKRVAISGERSKAGAIGGATPKQLLSKPEAIAKQMLKQNGSKPEAIAHTPTTTSTTTGTGTENTHENTPRKRGAGALYRYAEFRAVYPDERALPEAKAMNWWGKNVQWGDDAKVEQILANTRIWNGTEQFRDGKAWNIGKYLSEGMVFNPPKQAAPARPVQQEDDVAITLRLLREGRAAALADEAAAKAAAGGQ